MLKRIPFAEHPTIWQGLQTCYECQDITGTNIRSIYRTREGTATTDASNLTTTGKLRKAFSFIGLSSDYINLTGQLEKAVGEIFEVGKPFSIGFWVKPSTISGNKAVFSTTATSLQKGFYIAINGGYPYVVTVGTTSSSYDGLKTDSPHASIGVWMHQVITYGGGAIDSDWKFIINGVSVPWSVVASSGIVTSISSVAKNAYIGTTSSSAHFAGDIEQVLIWNREVTVPEALWLAEGHISDQSWKEVA